MLNHSASLAMSTSVLKALPGKLDIKRHSPSILYLTLSGAMKDHRTSNLWHQEKEEAIRMQANRQEKHTRKNTIEPRPVISNNVAF